MICFEVKINGKKMCLAGIQSDYGIVTAILEWVRRDLENFPEESRESVPEEELRLHVDGAIAHGKNDHENLRWLDRPLSLGDKICIRIMESSHGDEPQFRERSDPDFVEKARREYYKKLRREYENHS